MKAGELETLRLRPAMHDVQALDRVARRAFHQVVERGNDHNPSQLAVKREPDITVVAAAENLWLRVSIDALALLDKPDEWLGAILLAVHVPDAALIAILPK